jgi:TetR/AcrR family transcriptional repressor of nem operon
MSEPRSKTREEAKRETREALIRAGIEAFAAEGVDLPSLDAICARAGFTRGAFYVHFKDRDDFLLSVMDKVLSEFINSVIATGEYGEDLRKTVDLFIGAAENGLLPMVFGEINLRVLLEAGSRNPAIRERFAVLLGDAITRMTAATGDAQAAGTVREDLRPDDVGMLLVASAVGLVVLTEAEVKLDISGMRETVYRLFLKNPG